MNLVDDTHTIRVSVPATWTEVDTAPRAGADGSTLAWIAASPDLAGFMSGSTFEVPGVWFTGRPATTDTQSLVAQAAGAACTDAGVFPYADGVFVGSVRVLVDCGVTRS